MPKSDNQLGSDQFQQQMLNVVVSGLHAEYQTELATKNSIVVMQP